MQPTITPLDATLGAKIADIDLAGLDDATWRLVEDAFHEHALLIFPGQNLDDKAQIAFSNRFGEIELLRGSTDHKAVSISNQKPDGSVLQPEDHRYKNAARQ